jgi:predicted amidohydrolase YtcJ
MGVGEQSGGTALADVVMLGGRILTMDASRTLASAMSIKDGRVLLVGSDEEVSRTVHAGTKVVCLDGRTVVPGMIDAHTHVELTAYARHFWTDIRSLGVPEILAKIRTLGGKTPPGQWIVFQGTFGQSFPTRQELDEVAPEHCVALRWSMHKQQLNSAALTASEITRQTIAPPGIRIHRETDGSPSGLIEEGWDLIGWTPPGESTVAPALKETLHELFLRNGVTTVNEVAASMSGVRAYQKLAADGKIPRMGLAFTASPGHQALVDADNLGAMGLQTGFGNQRVRLQALKIFVDGGRDGAFHRSDLTATAPEWGLLTRTPQRLAQEIAAAVDAGLQVWVHAIGDLAQEIAVSAVEEVARRNPGLDHRTRIEHFGNEMYDLKRLHRLHAAGGIAVPNPGFVFAEPDDPGNRKPPHVDKYGLRTLKRVSGLLPGNSDTAGAQPFTCNPWFVMQCMVLQENRNGRVVSSDETVSLDDALAAFTRDAAVATFREHEIGTLEPGKLADCAVIDSDPFAVPARELASIKTLATMVAGEIVFGNLELHAGAPVLEPASEPREDDTRYR